MKRLDTALVERGLFESRNKAAEAIRKGRVFLDGHVQKKPAFKVGEETEITLQGGPVYVSRSAQKLAGYLQEHPLETEGKRCLDIGSSTGGFTQVLLEKGAAGVDAVDVGRDQLHPSLRADPRVRSYEQTDIRDFDPGIRYPLIVSDVSFISLHHILPSVARLAAPGAEVILLFKPQFEVGREAKRDRKGVVTDSRAIERAMERFEAVTEAMGWQLLRKTPSSLAGKEGNVEWVYHFRIP
ncbi:23S rRNA (cytidine-2'-O)-methyltransferase TlyA [Nitratifractor salsuginis]|uniref:Hemolysin A n=1 Tax=Nitratifractor salsuginis (strain DSM 16511 / JCM 12458 / E9I37-1) TaxID=749222 RepID=E6X0W0_NITSE|nr:TlyA family RNA methyltransferase [Nitratifractor salsuginis]ADV46892.1 hemolysin A [Nitratifractor salsuginis DSM 16511]